MIKFRSKFQFQILLQFYRTAEKVTEIKLVMVMDKSLTNTTIFSTFHILVSILFFHDYKVTLTNNIFTKKDLVQE